MLAVQWMYQAIWGIRDTAVHITSQVLASRGAYSPVEETDIYQIITHTKMHNYKFWSSAVEVEELHPSSSDIMQTKEWSEIKCWEQKNLTNLEFCSLQILYHLQEK